MAVSRSVEYFDRQFDRQVHAPDFALNPFKRAAWPRLRGKVLGYGCGLGQMTLAAARAGCEVLADIQLDGLAELVPITGSDIRCAMGSGGQTRD